MLCILATRRSIGRIYFGRRIIRPRRILRLFKINAETHKTASDE